MPLSLVLHATFTSWRRDLVRWNAWNTLVGLEETLLERARGAFLARWFGPGLPTYEGGLVVHLANIDELKRRYQELKQGAGSGSGRNLTEPLAGMVGTLAGALLSPPSAFLLMPVIAEQLPRWWTKLAGALTTISFGWVGVLVAALGVPLVGLGVPYLALTATAETSALFNVLGPVTDLLIAARRFLEQLTGPREKVRNPLLQRLLGVLDAVAGLVPHLFAFAGVVIAEIGPMLGPFAKQLGLLISLAEDVFNAVDLALTDLSGRLKELRVGKDSPPAIVERIIGTFAQTLGLMKTQAGQLFKTGGKIFETVPVPPAAGTKGPPKHELRIWQVLKDAFGKVVPFIEQMTTKSWLARRGLEIKERLTRIGAILDQAAKDAKLVKKPKPTWTSDPKGAAKQMVIGWFKGGPAIPWPKAPSIGEFPSGKKIFEEIERAAKSEWRQPSVIDVFKKAEPPGGYVFVLGPDAVKALDKIRRPPVDPFLAERKALRSALFSVIDTLLPDLLGKHVPMLQGLLWELDTELYGKDAEFPVRELPGGDLLDLKVGPLRIRSPGPKGRALKAWGGDLKRALEEQVYKTQAAAAT